MGYEAIVDWPNGFLVVWLNGAGVDHVVKRFPFATRGIRIDSPWIPADPAEIAAERMAERLNAGGPQAERARRDIQG